MRPALALGLALLALPALAQTAAEHLAWPALPTRFESTGGGGWIIDRYQPVRLGDRCVTAFSVFSPEGREYRNIASFEAVPVAGGVLCRNGIWRAEDGSGEPGTTPLRVFLRDDGARFGAP
jgi:hypothetical protein